MNARVSKISLIVFIVLLSLSLTLLSVVGDYWPWYAVMSVFSVIPTIVGPRRYRIMGATALLLSGVLIVTDVVGGARFHAEHPEIRR